MFERFTLQARAAVALAAEEARAAGHEPEDILLALTAEPGTGATRILLELTLAINALLHEQLVVRPERVDEDERVAITPAGLSRVERWLERIVPLFGGWPPEHPGADDATG